MIVSHSPKFSPVTITLETREELEAFITIIGIAYESCDSGSDAEKLAYTLDSEVTPLSR